MTADIIRLPPKSKTGAKRNCKWKVTFDRVSRRWTWEVTTTIENVFTGAADTEAAAMKEVEIKLKQLCQ